MSKTPDDFTEDIVDAPAALLARVRAAAAERGEIRLMGNAAKKNLKNFGATMSAEPGAKKPRQALREDTDPRVLGGYTGARKSARDPQNLSSVMERMMAARGWKEPVAVSAVLARWDELMGQDVAEHAKPEKYEDSTVTVRCTSTAWATNLRMMTSEIIKKFDRELGEGVVTQVIILGPQGRNWKRGRFVAPGGRGPRDTYG